MFIWANLAVLFKQNLKCGVGPKVACFPARFMLPPLQIEHAATFVTTLAFTLLKRHFET